MRPSCFIEDSAIKVVNDQKLVTMKNDVKGINSYKTSCTTVDLLQHMHQDLRYNFFGYQFFDSLPKNLRNPSVAILVS